MFFEIKNLISGAVVAARSKKLVLLLLHGTGGPLFESQPSFEFSIFSNLSFLASDDSGPIRLGTDDALVSPPLWNQEGGWVV